MLLKIYLFFFFPEPTDIFDTIVRVISPKYHLK